MCERANHPLHPVTIQPVLEGAGWTAYDIGVLQIKISIAQEADTLQVNMTKNKRTRMRLLE